MAENFDDIRRVGNALCEMLGIDPYNCQRLEINITGRDITVTASVVPTGIEAEPLIRHFTALAFKEVQIG